ncbi:hypothetical protein CG51_14180 [Haematobacter missouriensis]|nr:hypothetical protein CG51_14180 [Haematobacter missouriensis]
MGGRLVDPVFLQPSCKVFRKAAGADPGRLTGLQHGHRCFGELRGLPGRCQQGSGLSFQITVRPDMGGQRQCCAGEWRGQRLHADLRCELFGQRPHRRHGAECQIVKSPAAFLPTGAEYQEGVLCRFRCQCLHQPQSGQRKKADRLTQSRCQREPLLLFQAEPGCHGQVCPLSCR